MSPRVESATPTAPGSDPGLTGGFAEVAVPVPLRRLFTYRVPAEIEKILLAGLEKRPEDRPLPHEVAQACEPVLARLPAPRLTGWRA